MGPPGSPTGAPAEYVVDQQVRQVQQVQALQPINGPQYVGVDGSKTPPQVTTMVSPMDGELPRPSGAGNDSYRRARDIRRDPTVRMVRELSMAPLVMAEWEYETTTAAPAGAEDLVREVMTGLRLRLLRTSLCGQCDYGWQPYEIIAEARSDGSSAPRLKPLLQDITSILVNAADGSFFGMRQTPVIGLRVGWIYLLDQECFLVSQDVEGTNWYGESTLRSVEKWYDESEVISQLARKYFAKVSGTHWVVYFPLGTSTYRGVVMDNGDIAKELLSCAEAVGGIIVPRSVISTMDSMNAALAASEAAQWKIELLTDKGQGQAAFGDRLKYLDVLKVRAFGFPERSILEGQFGTKADATAHADIAVTGLEMRHALLASQYDDKLVDRVLSWNFGPDAKKTVRIKPSPLEDDTKDFFQKLYLELFANPQGYMTEAATLDMEQLRDRLGLPAHQWDQMQQAAAWDPYSDPYGLTLPQPGADPASLLPGTAPALATPPGFALPPGAGLSLDRLSDAADAAAAETDEEPTEKRRRAGNYRKGKVRMHGLTVTVENARGTRRRPEWKRLSAHYGYVNGTRGADGGQVDCFVGPDPSSELAFVVDQLDQRTRAFDEHKVMLGYSSKKRAVKAYRKNYPSSWKVGPVTPMHVGELRDWLDSGDTAKPLAEASLSRELVIVKEQPPVVVKTPQPKIKLSIPNDGQLQELVGEVKKLKKSKRAGDKKLMIALSRAMKRQRRVAAPVRAEAPQVDFAPLLAGIKELIDSKQEYDLIPERDPVTGITTKISRVLKKR